MCVSHLYRDFPIMVVATSSKPDAITAQVAMELLHVVKMTPPTEAQRLAMLSGLAGDYLTSPATPWPELARQTAVSGPLIYNGVYCDFPPPPRVLCWGTWCHFSPELVT